LSAFVIKVGKRRIQNCIEITIGGIRGGGNFGLTAAFRRKPRLTRIGYPNLHRTQTGCSQGIPMLLYSSANGSGHFHLQGSRYM
jgi:hypothetical protein